MRTRDEVLEAIRKNHHEVDNIYAGINELDSIIKKYRMEIKKLIDDREVLYREAVRLNSK